MEKEFLISSIRSSSREMVRQTGLLQNRFQSIGSPSLCHALVELDFQGEMNIAKLARILSLDQSTTSRLVEQMIQEGMCAMRPGEKDRRNKLISLTEKGAQLAQTIHSDAKNQVQQALNLLEEEERNTVVRGLAIYAKALKRANLQKDYHIRKLCPQDLPGLIRLIKSVWAEFGFDSHHPNAPIFEAELQQMDKTCFAERSSCFVLIHNDEIVGGVGFGPLAGEPEVCELKGMYLSSMTRGKGLGKMLLQHALHQMKEEGFTECYLETMDFMNAANSLYKKSGFIQLGHPKGNTGHSWTNCWYTKQLHSNLGKKC